MYLRRSVSAAGNNPHGSIVIREVYKYNEEEVQRIRDSRSNWRRSPHTWYHATRGGGASSLFQAKLNDIFLLATHARYRAIETPSTEINLYK